VGALNLSRSALLSACVTGILLVGCGRSANSPEASPGGARPGVIVTIDGKRHLCVVALYTEAQGSAIACNDVVSFVKDELRVPSGSIYDLRTIPEVDPAEMAKVAASLNGAGYRAIKP
jgi:hypothetical protein